MKDEYKGFLTVMIIWGLISSVLYASPMFVFNYILRVEYDKLLMGIICMSIALIISIFICFTYEYSVFIPHYLEEKND
jgi:hypothetical protein